MKKLTCTTILIAAICLASGATALSQDTPRPARPDIAPVPPNAPEAPFAPQGRVTIDPNTGLPMGAKVEIDPNTGLPLPASLQTQKAMEYDNARRAYADALAMQTDAQKLQSQFAVVGAQAKAQAEKEMSEAAAANGFYPQAGGGGWERMPNFVYNAFGSSGRADRSLVIRFTETDPKSIATAEEDLNIMGRILEKALSQKGEDEQRHAMGIKLVSVLGPGSARNLQIEGQGAIFMLNINFPLAGPAGNTNETASNEPSNSTWDEAKREVYGQPSGREGDPFAGAFPRQEFDPKRVENLKDSVLEALKNASNMHSLKSDETVTVVVTSETGEPGFGVTRGMTMRGGSSGGGGGGGFGKMTSNEKKNRRPDAPSASVMTLRAKKSDIDAFAKGKLALDDFRKKANVSIY